MIKYSMSPLVAKYYKVWISSPTLFGHPLDQQRFYRFVKACGRYSKISRLNGQWLRHFLELDLAQKFSDPDDIERQIQTAVGIFDHIRDYLETSFPDDLIEMRDPFRVKLALESLRRGDGSRLVSDEEVKKTILDNFGADWQRDHLKKVGLL